ncbi:conserved hypothetical protein [Capnocytophaga canis]|uniref:hypothetical protein n=1 Tax=Capnocytophaga canis TaxID=1848903 RepID=UPI0005897694|nr:hypothetical protein [Capnocytophaga canis]CEN44265.1 conserved hypothetical protein [Capnocytophaga canis]
MDENLTERILDYIQQKTNYAVIITGKYGIGKTYYIDNILSPRILQSNEGENKIKFIRISLFGVATIEEIQRLIFFEMYSYLKKLNTKGVKVFSGLLNGVTSFFGVDFQKVLEDIEKNIEVDNYQNIVICLDDIDRRSSSLKLCELYGFINDLVENKSAKVILIANEDTLRQETNKDEKDTYSILSEKVIGISLPFQSNYSDIISNMIKQYEEDDDDNYKNFLEKNLSYITQKVAVKDNNLRNVIFFFGHFKRVFITVNELINEDSELKKYEEKIFTDVLKFSLPISFEYKLGKLSAENKELLLNYLNDYTIRLSDLGIADGSDKKDYLDDFLEQYSDVLWTQNNFPSIVEYITGETTLDKAKILSEIKKNCGIFDEGIPEEQRLLEELSFWNSMKLSYEEYINKTNRLIELIDQDKFRLREYPDIFYLIMRFDNPTKQNIEELKQKIIDKINSKDDEYDKMLEVKYFQNLPDLIHKEILDACLKKNKEILHQNEKKEKEKLLSLFESDMEKFEQEIRSKWLDKPIFLSDEYENYWRVIEKHSNYDKMIVGSIIDFRYKESSIVKYLLEEKQFLEFTKNKINEKMKNNDMNNIEKFVFENIINKIKSVLPNFE